MRRSECSAGRAFGAEEGHVQDRMFMQKTRQFTPCITGGSEYGNLNVITHDCISMQHCG